MAAASSCSWVSARPEALPECPRGERPSPRRGRPCVSRGGTPDCDTWDRSPRPISQRPTQRDRPLCPGIQPGHARGTPPPSPPAASAVGSLAVRRPPPHSAFDRCSVFYSLCYRSFLVFHLTFQFVDVWLDDLVGNRHGRSRALNCPDDLLRLTHTAHAPTALPAPERLSFRLRHFSHGSLSNRRTLLRGRHSERASRPGTPGSSTPRSSRTPAVCRQS